MKFANKQPFVTAYEFRILSMTILLAISGSLGLDIHLASLPHIMRYMHTDAAHMQQSVSLFLLGLGLSILLYGPLSDRVGRRPVILCGLALACVASFSSAVTHHITPFLITRFLQGVGSGVCWGLGRIIAADVMQGERLAAMGSYFTTFIGLSPMLAPAIGGYMQHWFGWQANFILLGSLLLLVLLIMVMFLSETNHHKNPQAFDFKPLVTTYLSLFKERMFMGCIALTGLAMSANFIYVTVSSFIFQHNFKLSSIVFGWLTAAVGVASIVSKLIAPIFIYRLKRHKCLVLGLLAILCSGVLLATMILLGFNGPTIVLICACITMFGMVMININAMSVALSPFHNRRGAAGAIYGSFQLLISFVSSTTASWFAQEGSGILASAYVILSVIGLLAYFYLVHEIPDDGQIDSEAV